MPARTAEVLLAKVGLTLAVMFGVPLNALAFREMFFGILQVLLLRQRACLNEPFSHLCCLPHHVQVRLSELRPQRRLIACMCVCGPLLGLGYLVAILVPR